MSAHHATRVSHSARSAQQHPPLARLWPFRLGGAYVVLALVLLASAVSSSMFALFPPTAETPRSFDAGMAALDAGHELRVVARDDRIR